MEDIKLENKEMEKNVNHPDHYNTHQLECIDEMIIVFGIDAVIDFCKCNAWKYRYRAGNKDDIKQDLAKSDWYINKARELESIKNREQRWINDGGKVTLL